MTPEQLAQILDDLGERLGPTGRHVFELAVRQIVIEGIVSLVGGMVLAVIAVWIWRKSKAWVFSRQISSYGDELLDRGMPMAGVAMATAVLGAIGLSFIYGAVTTLANPEYAAIRDLLKRIVP